MNRTAFRIALALATLTAFPAAAGPANSGALGVPANRIVGLWATHAVVGPCGGPPPSIPISNYLLFNAGGTVVEMFPAPPSRTAFRTYGLGTWSYDPATHRYTMRLQFDRFDADGNYTGSGKVDRVLVLSSDGQQATGPVHAVQYDPDGNPLVEFCGEPVSDRL